MTTERGFVWSRNLWLGGKVAFALGVVGAAAYWLWFTPMHVDRHTITSEEVIAEVMGTGTLDRQSCTRDAPSGFEVHFARRSG